MTTKLTNEQIEANELETLADAILDGSLELNADFIARYCGEEIAEQLLRLPDAAARLYCLEGTLGEGFFPGTVCGPETAAVYLPHNEIEVQFEGNPEDVFESPNDLFIRGDLAYLYTGYGALFPCDTVALKQNVDEYLAPC